MARLRIAEHPHMATCPHCGTERPRVSVERDALEVTWLTLQENGDLNVDEPGVGLLDNSEVHFTCCSKRVYDEDLADALIEEVYG